MYDVLSIIPVNSLRVFEAAARLESFSCAASELNITPGAVSQQIKKIEARCGVGLFERVGREVQLTEHGRLLWNGVADGLKALDAAAHNAMYKTASTYISISTVSSVAIRWLVPRLDRWRELKPDVDIRVSTSGQLVDLSRDQIDLAIRIGGEPNRGLDSRFLLRDQIIPVCSPGLLSNKPPLSEPGELARHTLIHFTPSSGTVRTDWKGWLTANRVEGVNPDRGLFFDDLVAAINSTMGGQGVLLAPRSHIEDDLRSGLLVAPLGNTGHRAVDWYVGTLSSPPLRPPVAEFIDWLIADA